ncbi:hypothetical protein LJK88_00270 [Paenibacillus sp. P26]|nr:hypothetical protein LJK88_00270 [Paenibacillus sp. P26]
MDEVNHPFQKILHFAGVVGGQTAGADLREHKDDDAGHDDHNDGGQIKLNSTQSNYRRFMHAVHFTPFRGI